MRPAEHDTKLDKVTQKINKEAIMNKISKISKETSVNIMSQCVL